MTLLQSALLGALQGITEFLPISSSAHLIVVPWLFKIKAAGMSELTYDVFLHFGTLLATLCIYGRRFASVVVEGLLDARDGKILQSNLGKIILATIPAAIIGVAGKGFIEAHLRTPMVAVFTLVAVSLLMFVAERLPHNRKEISLSAALLIGIAQAVALIPGASRSGITIAAAMVLGLKRKNAVEFSFLLSIPIILGASLHEMRHIQFDGTFAPIYLVGGLSAFVFGLIGLKFLIRYLSNHSLDLFAYYRIGLAALIAFFPV